MKILLCGFMASGKSTLLNSIKNEAPAEFNFIDLDEFINYKFGHGTNLGEYIEDVGWDKFRELESLTINNFLDSSEDMVISLGGGTLNETLITKIYEHDVKLIFLNIPFEDCILRLRANNSSHRPLTKKSDQELLELYEQRSFFYRKAHLKLNKQKIDEIKNFSDFLSCLKRNAIII